MIREFVRKLYSRNDFAVLFLAVFFSFFSVSAHSQEKPFYSTTYQNTDSLNDASRDLVFVNPILSLEIAKNALELSLLQKYERGQAYAYRNFANVYIQNEVYYIGTQYLQTASEIFEKTKDTLGIADCNISFGFLYRKLQELNNEIYYFEKAYDFYKISNNPGRLGICALNLSESYFTNKGFDKCRSLVTEAIRLNEQSRQLQVLSACYKVTGDLELIHNNINSSTEYYNRVLELSGQLGENSQKVATVASMLGLAEISGLKNDFQKQEGYLIKALEFSQQNNLLTNITEAYNKLISFYLSTNNLKKVNEYFSEFKNISDSINNRRLSDKTNLVTNLARTHQIEIENKYLEQTSELQQNEIKKRNVFLVIIATIALFLIAIMIKLHQASKKIKSQNKILKDNNILINRHKKVLSELLLTRDKMFSIIAHDLKTPFNSLISYTSFIIDEFDELENKQIKKYIRDIKDSSELTFDMLNKLLLWAKNQSDGFVVKSQTILVNELVEQTLLPLSKAAELKNIEINTEIEENTIVKADSDMLATVLRNLVQNAIKYSPEKTYIKISAKRDKDIIIFEVKDSGIGMEKSVLDNLFVHDKEKIRAGTAGEIGTGLGLIICKDFVEKNKGELQVESVLNEGTTFSFTLPAAIN